MKLIELTVKYERQRDLAHITYLIERTADDTARFGKMAVGKGAVACSEGKIELLSMGMDKGFPPPGSDRSCPEPRSPQPDSAVICAT